VPTVAGSTYRQLRPEVDELVALMTPEPFFGVGQCYQDFSQTSDAEVTDLIERARSFTASTQSPKGLALWKIARGAFNREAQRARQNHFPPGDINSKPYRWHSRWREFAFWLHEVQRIVEPRLPLSCALEHWSQISAGPTRTLELGLSTN
jgi:hypothetical protein